MSHGHVDNTRWEVPAHGARRRGLRPRGLHERSDEQLVASFRAGREEAFSLIYERYQPRLSRYAQHMLAGSPYDGDEVVQDVFLSAYHALRTGTGSIALRPWLYRIAHNRCLDHLRRPRLQFVTHDVGLLAGPHESPANVSERREQLRELVRDITRLPDRQRSALLMRELLGLSHAELGEALGISEPASKTLVARARMTLALAVAARNTGCDLVRQRLAAIEDGSARLGADVRLHLRDCAPCREYRAELRSVSRRLALLPGGGAGLLGLMKLLLAGGGVAGVGAATTSGGGTGAAGLAAALCCLALGGGGVALLGSGSGGEPAQERTPHTHHRQLPRPAGTKLDVASVLAAASSRASSRHQRRPVPGAVGQPSRSAPSQPPPSGPLSHTIPPSPTHPKRTIDLRSIGGSAARAGGSRTTARSGAATTATPAPTATTPETAPTETTAPSPTATAPQAAMSP